MPPKCRSLPEYCKKFQKVLNENKEAMVSYVTRIHEWIEEVKKKTNGKKGSTIHFVQTETDTENAADDPGNALLKAPECCFDTSGLTSDDAVAALDLLYDVYLKTINYMDKILAVLRTYLRYKNERWLAQKIHGLSLKIEFTDIKKESNKNIRLFPVTCKQYMDVVETLHWVHKYIHAIDSIL